MFTADICSPRMVVYHDTQDLHWELRSYIIWKHLSAVSRTLEVEGLCLGDEVVVGDDVLVLGGVLLHAREVRCRRR